jgi:maltose O-acetyltransferase
LAGPIQIGDNVLINLNSDISGRDYKVTIGDNVLIAPRVSILASMHNYRDRGQLIRDQGTSGSDVTIGSDVWIGTGAVVLPGVHIGQGAVIGANAVVTNDIAAYSIAVGIPAEVVGHRD